MTNEGEFSLAGVNIGITALDLEQTEHRGIAQVTKDVISALASEKANIYLITSYGSSRLGKSDIKKISTTAIKEITLSDILEKLKETKDPKNIYLKKLSLYLSLPKLIIDYYLKLGEVPHTKYLLDTHHKNIHGDSERMSYLNKLKGIISSPGIFNICRLKSRRFILGTPKINLKKCDLDVLISSSPISIQITKNKFSSEKLIQIIHDAIPLLYNKHPDHPVHFYQRLKDAITADQVLYVSESTKTITNNILETNNIDNARSNIINPLPSISSSLLEKAKSIDSKLNPKKNFILFNSSIVARKNLDTLIYDFLSSDLPKNDYKLCVAGKLHRNEYCNYIKEISKQHDCIELLDYVNEIDKAWLYLNAQAFVSPSATEGFGIPALDASSLGMKTLLSEIPSHIEIYRKIKNNKEINLIPTNDSKSWIEYMNLILEKNQTLDDKEKDFRISCYKDNKNNFSEKFNNTLKEIILN